MGYCKWSIIRLERTKCTNDLRVKYIKVNEKYFVSASSYRCRKITRPYARLFIRTRGGAAKDFGLSQNLAHLYLYCLAIKILLDPIYTAPGKILTG